MRVVHEIRLISDDGSTIARARGSDATGWHLMSIRKDLRDEPMVSVKPQATLRKAFALRIYPEFFPALDAALAEFRQNIDL